MINNKEILVLTQEAIKLMERKRLEKKFPESDEERLLYLLDRLDDIGAGQYLRRCIGSRHTGGMLIF